MGWRMCIASKIELTPWRNTTNSSSDLRDLGLWPFSRPNSGISGIRLPLITSRGLRFPLLMLLSDTGAPRSEMQVVVRLSVVGDLFRGASIPRSKPPALRNSRRSNPSDQGCVRLNLELEQSLCKSRRRGFFLAFLPQARVSAEH